MFHNFYKYDIHIDFRTAIGVWSYPIPFRSRKSSKPPFHIVLCSAREVWLAVRLYLILQMGDIIGYGIWDPFEEIKKIRKEMDNLFKNFGKISMSKGLKLREPLTDIINKKDEIIVNVELPGIDKRDINLVMEDDRIEIKAEKKEEKETKRKDYYKQERYYKGFYKSFTLPASINPDKAKAKFINGVLTINLTKTKGKLKKRKVLSLK